VDSRGATDGPYTSCPCLWVCIWDLLDLCVQGKQWIVYHNCRRFTNQIVVVEHGDYFACFEKLPYEPDQSQSPLQEGQTAASTSGSLFGPSSKQSVDDSTGATTLPLYSPFGNPPNVDQLRQSVNAEMHGSIAFSESSA